VGSARASVGAVAPRTDAGTCRRRSRPGAASASAPAWTASAPSVLPKGRALPASPLQVLLRPGAIRAPGCRRMWRKRVRAEQLGAVHRAARRLGNWGIRRFDRRRRQVCVDGGGGRGNGIVGFAADRRTGRTWRAPRAIRSDTYRGGWNGETKFSRVHRNTMLQSRSSRRGHASRPTFVRLIGWSLLVYETTARRKGRCRPVGNCRGALSNALSDES